MNEIDELIKKLSSFLDIRESWKSGELSHWVRGKPDIRPILNEISGLEEDGLKVRRKKMWREVQKKIEKKKERRIMLVSLMRYAAMLVITLSLGYVFLWIREGKKKYDVYLQSVATPERYTPGEALLVLESGEKVGLSSLAQDSVLRKRGVEMQSDSLQIVSFKKVKIESREEIYNTLIIPRAGEYTLELADGTKVWLNSDSELRFPVEFVSQQRRVFLKGEAYFKVKKDEEKPFIVEAEGMHLKVLGTEFNVCAYEPEITTQTTLVSGKVWLRNTGSGEEIYLKPGQQARLSPGKTEVKEVDVSNFISWREGKFYFEQLELLELAKQLERWFDITFCFQNPQAKNYKFTGVICKDLKIEEIMQVIMKTTFQVELVLQGNVIIVK